MFAIQKNWANFKKLALAPLYALNGVNNTEEKQINNFLIKVFIAGYASNLKEVQTFINRNPSKEQLHLFLEKSNFEISETLKQITEQDIGDVSEKIKRILH
ncbi:MAG: hypothetical protein OQL19_10220 [Gammaproteobacteria bacterium]|nr:hypothetical protein [Gammaproteobacteria bacterium]